MKGQDLQVGDTWTAPTERGKGLARWALEKAINRFSTEDNNIWYVCEETNLASIKVAHSAKMHLVGRGCRSTKFGLSIFGQFLINEKFFKQ